LTESRPVAILGGGSIGVAWAIVFARGGVPVRIWDALPDAFPRAEADLDDRLRMLGLGEETRALVTMESELAAALDGVALAQENVPEQLAIKRDLLARTAELTSVGTILASSSSAIIPTMQAEELPDDAAARFLIAHPANPPYLLPILELVPGIRTSDETTDTARALYSRVGMRPVVVNGEPEGFLYNRLQGAVLREAYALVRDGVASVDDIDEIMRSGLGRRWSVIGPFETADLNTRGGIESHAAKMGPAYERMGAERGQHDPWTPELVQRVAAQRRAILPLDEWDERVRWRDERLLELTALWDSMTQDPAATSTHRAGV
jgi:3-hydroxyacyl-CoA dehydrogenase